MLLGQLGFLPALFGQDIVENVESPSILIGENQPLFQHVQQFADDLHRRPSISAIFWPDSELSQEDHAGQIFREEPVQAGLFESLGTLWEEPVGVHEIVIVEG